MRDFSSKLPISESEIVRMLESGIPGVDATRSKSYGELARLRDAKAKGLAREQRLLAQKHGRADHVRVAEARQRFGANENFRREVAVMRETVETPVPNLSAESLIVHGFVRRRSDQSGIAGVTLALTDNEGNWIREFGYACTDSRGYFQLKGTVASEPRIIEPDQAETKPEARASNPLPRPAQIPGKPAPEFPDPERVRTLRLRVFDREGRVLHTEARPVRITAATIDYRLILIGDEATECVCTPPPAKVGGAAKSSRPTQPAQGTMPPYSRPSQQPGEPQARVSELASYQAPQAGDFIRQRTPTEASQKTASQAGGETRQTESKPVEKPPERQRSEVLKPPAIRRPTSKKPARIKPAELAAQKEEESKPVKSSKKEAKQEKPRSRKPGKLK